MKNTLDLTTTELLIIFTKVSTITTEKFMTVDQQIRLEASENTTFEHVKGLLEKGMNADFIADAFKIPLQRVEEIIRKIKGN